MSVPERRIRIVQEVPLRDVAQVLFAHPDEVIVVCGHLRFQAVSAGVRLRHLQLLAQLAFILVSLLHGSLDHLLLQFVLFCDFIFILSGI